MKDKKRIPIKLQLNVEVLPRHLPPGNPPTKVVGFPEFKS